MLRSARIVVFLVMIFGIMSVAPAEPKKGPVATRLSDVDDDYAFGGEYVGQIENSEGTQVKMAAQVVARGKGEFLIVGYVGGLPGDGWKRGDKRMKLTGKREGGSVNVVREDRIVGKIGDGKMTVWDPEKSERRLELKKVERKSPTLGAKSPAGAMVLFDGSGTDNLAEGEMNDENLLWAGAATKSLPSNFVLHLEFMTPYMPEYRGQGRANSGVYLHDCYELQVLDSFGLEGHDNECGGLYKLRVPDVNMCLPPLVWQTYDIDFTAPKYDAEGKKTAGGRATIRHNGVVIHEDVELSFTPGRLEEGPAPRALYLQKHGNKVQYRNIWVKEK
jgi:3-keto-disaccharide hydrolase